MNINKIHIKNMILLAWPFLILLAITIAMSSCGGFVNPENEPSTGGRISSPDEGDAVTPGESGFFNPTVDYDGVYYVDGNLDSNGNGTKEAPLNNIQSAIDLAYSIYLSQAKPTQAEVRVAKGLYTVDSSKPSGSIQLKNGVDIKGGYDGENWNNWPDSKKNQTLVVDLASSGGDAYAPTAALLASDTNSSLKGFTIVGGNGVHSAAVVIQQSSGRYEILKVGNLNFLPMVFSFKTPLNSSILF